jgi:MFS family permease
MAIGSILLYAFWTTVHTISSALAFVIFFGTISGAIIGLPPASVANIINLSPDAELSKLGQWTGMMYTASAPFALTGPIIAGHLITMYGNNYLTVQLWSATCLFLSALCMAAAIWTSRRRALGFRQTFSSATSIKNMLRGDTDEEKSVGIQSTIASALNSQVFPRRQSDNEEN